MAGFTLQGREYKNEEQDGDDDLVDDDVRQPQLRGKIWVEHRETTPEDVW